jgi:hypothetical protein
MRDSTFKEYLVDWPFKAYLELGPCLQILALVCGVSGSRCRATHLSV